VADDYRVVEVKGSLEHDFLDSLKKWSKGPDFKTIGKLEAVIDAAFAATQTFVHIDTGSLKSSGKVESDYDGVTALWTGTIVYGGESGGINDPVRYAIYEQRRRGVKTGVGTTHDFMTPIPAYYPLVDKAVIGWMSGGQT